jgi:hypothetical protein
MFPSFEAVSADLVAGSNHMSLASKPICLGGQKQALQALEAFPVLMSTFMLLVVAVVAAAI